MQNTVKTPTRNAFESYFKKMLDDFWKNKNNSLPKVPYRESIDLDLVQPNTIENGYVQWLPKLQNSAVDIEDIETRIGSKIHPEVLQTKKLQYRRLYVTCLEGWK